MHNNPEEKNEYCRKLLYAIHNPADLESATKKLVDRLLSMYFILYYPDYNYMTTFIRLNSLSFKELWIEHRNIYPSYENALKRLKEFHVPESESTLQNTTYWKRRDDLKTIKKITDEDYV